MYVFFYYTFNWDETIDGKMIIIKRFVLIRNKNNILKLIIII